MSGGWIGNVLLGVASVLSVWRVAGSSVEETAVERGRYLVHDVAQCVQCHTPRAPNGRLLTARLLQGAPVPVENPFPDQPWGFAAPHIAGLPGWEVESFVQLLISGERADGSSPRPPMPPFRFSEADARAVAAYLKSLE